MIVHRICLLFLLIGFTGCKVYNQSSSSQIIDSNGNDARNNPAVEITVKTTSGEPIFGAEIYVDNEYVGKTWHDGTLKDIPARQGRHTIRADWQGSTGSDSFEARIGPPSSVTIILSTPPPTQSSTTGGVTGPGTPAPAP